MVCHEAREGKDRAQHRRDLVARQGREAQLVRELFTLQLRQPAAKPQANLIAAVGADQQQRLGVGAPQQVEQKIEAARIAPVQILDNHQQRLGFRLSGKAGDQRLEQPPLLLRGIEGQQRRWICRKGH